MNHPSTDDDPDFRIDPTDFDRVNEIVQVQIRGVWIWCVRHAGVELRRGVSRRQLSDDELLALLHSLTN